ncbi:uncharacterized protein TrAFT101_007553 [Trichoderma asperellum]|uniref:Uncharacterized protein n=1 Tax=Trichoderma asperellum (strain ATCC 204424 / CBS 433.97 / NBRC 101777) TaxID=1042311 RepID=A0A2T3Z4J0_TRIA4|nr:hypothetical protein M441DRAFT_143598 [Trichoderma asperellum CBS 433.97]PTB39670.1 hypothetical protein M441DRAFT_143598 [Trichoderma asperellum CBS 433.97]UKZ92609.1 hypothetical protein TrAFT101_007553 [Trichoderma asperellum]
MDDRSRNNSEAQSHATNIDHTLKELQRKVREYEAQLSELRSAEYKAPSTAAGQAQILKTAFDDVANSEPFLPFPGSVLPALLALRKTHQTIQESKAFLASQTDATERIKKRLKDDESALKDQQLLNEALKQRIETLRSEADSGANAQPEDEARKRIEELRRKKQKYNKETSKLMKSLNRFINDHLAVMLAAEAMGGPVVGDLMDADAEEIAAGFNAQGKLKKPKGEINKDKNQRRIDDIWGPSDDSGKKRDVATAAGEEMRQLTEELLNKLVEAKGSSSDAYVRLPYETASARFLIRSNVAQFHPKDAMRIRLVDYGRELDD